MEGCQRNTFKDLSLEERTECAIYNSGFFYMAEGLLSPPRAPRPRWECYLYTPYSYTTGCPVKDFAEYFKLHLCREARTTWNLQISTKKVKKP